VNGGIEYKVWIGGKVVDDKFYSMIETITVEQGIDLATEARVELEMCADDQGKWSGVADSYSRTWTRLRIEVRNQTSTWVPLIDGPIVTWHASMSGEPGQSTVTLVAHDDTAYLNLDARRQVFEGDTDEDVINKLFDDIDSITDVVIEDLPDQPDDRPLKHIKLGTKIDMLRSIADPYDLHVYVVPDDLDTSIAYVKRLATKNTSGLPVFVLTGSDRNVETFDARNEVHKARRYQGQQLDIDTVDPPPDPIVSMFTDDDGDDDEPTSKPNPYGDDSDVPDSKPNPYDAPSTDTGSKPNPYGDPVALLAENPAIDSLKNLGTEILSPFVSAFRDVGELIQRWQQKSSYTITATGSVRYGCYNGVLRAYDLVGVGGVSAKLSTNFIVREVTHTLSRSEYRQDFTLMTNATRTVQTSPGASAVPASVF
jgi:hypothetical protein